MGKGSRNREIRIAEGQSSGNPTVKLSKLQLIKQQEKKQKIKRYVTMVSSIVVAVALIVGIIFLFVSGRVKLEGEISATSEMYQLDNAMIAFYMYDEYQSFLSQYSSYLSMFGFDVNKGLKEQMYSENMTWYDYFLTGAKSLASETVALASKATSEGISLSAEELKEIDDSIKALDEQAKKNGYKNATKYLEDFYCKGITADAAKKAIELKQLAMKYAEKLTDGYKFEEPDIVKYISENPSSFYKFDIISYPFTVTTPTGATAEQIKEAVDKAKAEADDFLSKITDEESMKGLINKLEAEKAAAKKDPAKPDTDKEEDKDKDYSETYVQEGKQYVEDDDFTKWAFSNERQVGDTTVIESKNSAGTVTGYTVYYLTRTSYMDDYATRDVRHILVKTQTYKTDEAAKSAADKIFQEYLKGDKTAEAFDALAKKYSEDPGSVSNGGLYEKVTQGYMVDEFNDWLFDEKRQKGDVEIVKTSYGYHVMYYVGENEIAYKITATDGLKQDAYQKDVDELKKAYPLTFDEEKLKDIPDKPVVLG